MQNAPADAVNLALGELGYALPDSLRNHALELMEAATPVYTPNAGLAELRELIAAGYAQDLSFKQVCVTNGAQEAVFLSLFSFIESGDVVAVPDPDYPAYKSVLEVLGAKVIRIPYSRDLRSVNWELWEKHLSQGVRALMMSSPNNPCGFFLRERDSRQLAQICSRHGICVVIDEIYQGLSFAGNPARLLGKLEELFIIGGLSKSHCMSGWRLGWVVSPQNLAATLVKAKQYLSTCSGWLSQKMALFALGKSGLAAADKVFFQLLESRALALSILKRRCFDEDLIVPDATPYLLVRVSGDDMEFSAKLAKKGVITAPGSAFGEQTKGMIRINYGIPIEILEPALDTLCDELYPH